MLLMGGSMRGRWSRGVFIERGCFFLMWDTDCTEFKKQLNRQRFPGGLDCV